MHILFLNYYPNNATEVNGVIFYMIEMMQYIRDTYNIDIVELLDINMEEATRFSVYSRYDKTGRFITTDKITEPVQHMFMSFNSLEYLLKNVWLFHDVVKHVKKIYLLNADGTHRIWQRCIKSNVFGLKKLHGKISLLTENGFENEFLESNANLSVIPIVRGLHFDHFEPKKQSQNNAYFLHTIQHGNIVTHTQQDLDLAYRYCKENDIEYSEEYVPNPANTYKGLIYFRPHDYMPRLPYEFWYYNKPVILLKTSDGLQKRIAQYGTNTYNWDLNRLCLI